MSQERVDHIQDQADKIVEDKISNDLISAFTQAQEANKKCYQTRIRKNEIVAELNSVITFFMPEEMPPEKYTVYLGKDGLIYRNSTSKKL